MKKCTYCKIEKDLSEFGDKKRNNKIYKSIYCRSCEALKAKLYRQKHPNKIKEYNQLPTTKERKKKFDQSPKSKNKRKKYYQKNKKKLIARSVAYVINKRKTNPVFRLRSNISKRIAEILKHNGSNKCGKSIFKYLDYTPEELKCHLEKQFDINMKWENYGSYWHLDHIIPQSDLPYSSMEDENFKICWSLSNLRSLEARQNISDGASRKRHKKK